jgi:NADH pyrophosphatase NudC (nudix superfamily)
MCPSCGKKMSHVEDETMGYCSKCKLYVDYQKLEDAMTFDGEK